MVSLEISEIEDSAENFEEMDFFAKPKKICQNFLPELPNIPKFLCSYPLYFDILILKICGAD